VKVREPVRRHADPELPGEDALDRAALILSELERQVRLIGRAAPADVAAESARFAREFAQGRKVRLAAVAGTRTELGEARRSLMKVGTLTAPLGPLGMLHAGRAAELELEARLVEALGTRELAPLAAERFPAPPAPGQLASNAFVGEALALSVPAAPTRHLSDDGDDPASLISQLRRRARELGLPLRIEVRRDQVAAAATGHGVVRLRPGLSLSRGTSARIAVHELFAHALPRAASLRAPWVLARVGTRGATDDEEGRAILIEERAGLFDAERRRSLALRHRAALGVRSGATPNDTIADLVALGEPLDAASDLAVRVHRGGGLGRELVYLPRYFALRHAFSSEPALERWFERGRFDLMTARRLEAGELDWSPHRRPVEPPVHTSSPGTRA
jgi:hypothetical protein